MSQLLPEQPESEASPATRAIYSELRRLCGVPMVPLIYRHLATISGGLEWAWSLLGPALRTGRLQEAAWTIGRSVQIEPVVKLPAAALRMLGVTDIDLAEFRKLLAAYNRSNPINLLGLRCLAVFAVQDPQAQVGSPPQIDCVTPWQPPEPVRDLLPMVDPANIQGDARALMVLLSDRGNVSRGSPIWPSLYRHFASRPPLLALSALVVPPAFPVIDEAAGYVQREAGTWAETLIDEIDRAQGAPSPSGEQRQAIIHAINLFTERLPELIAIGALLENSFPNSAQCTSST